MGRVILSVNAGSSSVKANVYHLKNPPVEVAAASVSGLTAPPSIFKYEHGSNHQKHEIEEEIKSPQDAFKYILKRLMHDQELQVVSSNSDYAYVCHRVVHGGDLEEEVIIHEKTFNYLETLQDLAPLHNTSALEIIKTCLQEVPSAKSVAYFDTMFHQCLPDYIKTYPIDPEVAKSKMLRKYGFHGISFSFILRSVSEFLSKPASETSLIALHLGSGASVCAIQGGKSIETTMGLTPLSGLPGATRSGDIDASLVFHYTSEASKLSSSSTKEMHISKAKILNKQSGWKALTGTTDFSKIGTDNPPTKMHKLAFDIFVDRIVGFIGNYFVKLNGSVDAIVFAGGIGERSALLRSSIAEKCRCLGIAIDSKANSSGILSEDQTVVDISEKSGQRPAVLVCQTDEAYEMAYQCMNKPPREEPTHF
ncbi:acetate kinase [Nannizzia gypsea CBS 118893]|uniref:Probable acetate kinase n=1 Tax=Arthroderma gypseum (strain ATCC MYA-4604 / CBS 118893) TaxID=535722 RepID=E5R3R6_ARTGP|nr:acetate kinase [Nannizzia gypsea CBS 118893]EFQ97976.1 acetate kinase [Nannizzia gypsea CBS 118893]